MSASSTLPANDLSTSADHVLRLVARLVEKWLSESALRPCAKLQPLRSIAGVHLSPTADTNFQVRPPVWSDIRTRCRAGGAPRRTRTLRVIIELGACRVDGFLTMISPCRSVSTCQPQALTRNPRPQTSQRCSACACSSCPRGSGRATSTRSHCRAVSRALSPYDPARRQPPLAAELLRVRSLGKPRGHDEQGAGRAAWDVVGVGTCSGLGWQVLTDLHGEIIVKEATTRHAPSRYDTQEYAYAEGTACRQRVRI